MHSPSEAPSTGVASTPGFAASGASSGSSSDNILTTALTLHSPTIDYPLVPASLATAPRVNDITQLNSLLLRSKKGNVFRVAVESPESCKAIVRELYLHKTLFISRSSEYNIM